MIRHDEKAHTAGRRVTLVFGVLISSPSLVLTRWRRLSSAWTAVVACFVLLGCAPHSDPDVDQIRIALIDGGVAEIAAIDCYGIEQSADAQASAHGTAIASVILDAVESPCADAGSVRLGSFPVLDTDGGGATADAVADALSSAIEWDADLVNISIDLRSGSERLEASVQQAATDGIMVIAAAGNRMGLAAGYPARYDSVLAVGAADPDGSRLWISAVEGVDIYEIGSGVRALDAHGNVFLGEGTSFAAAVHTRELADSLP